MRRLLMGLTQIITMKWVPIKKNTNQDRHEAF